ncbi:MAG: DUF3768 domain-containing protein [Acidimicrobiaceae bacterium]|jgi:hypothetical protein|nr:DUF3768 domain-containing protein [Acidimicrobiaceae bacterium]
MNSERTSQIRVLNDALRQDPQRGLWLVTSRLQSHPELPGILENVRSFCTFSQENDPYHEHDFGAFEFDGERYFWKIDYYDLTLSMASPDPCDETITRRVLTVMHASEY